MPVVKDNPLLSPHIGTQSALQLKPSLTMALIGKAYMAKGHASVALHAMVVLQAYQADWKWRAHQFGLNSSFLALHATNQTAHTFGCSNDVLSFGNSTASVRDKRLLDF